MRFTIEQAFDSAPVQVMAVLARPDIAEARARLDDDLGGKLLSHRSEGPGERPTAVDTVIGARIPDTWLVDRVGTPTMRRRETWHLAGDRYQGLMTVTVAHLPVTCEADLTLDPTGAGAVLRAEVSLAVTVPLLGPIIEQKVAGAMTVAMRTEAAALARWVAGPIT